MLTKIYDYDYGLGIEPEIIQYVKESNEIESRISSTPCYLFFQNNSGSMVGSSLTPITATDFILNINANKYSTKIWVEDIGDYPDVRPYTNNITILINSVTAVRVLAIEDLQHDNEFVVVERKDLSPATVEVWFNSNFNPNINNIQYYYSTFETGINDIRFARGEGKDQSIFGWTQYISIYSDVPFSGINQVLVRLPITPEALSINEEGRVRLQENDSWIIWEPYLHNYDLIVIPANYTFSGYNEIYEITNKRDSVMQGVLTSQRFKLKLLEPSDPRYKLTILTS